MSQSEPHTEPAKSRYSFFTLSHIAALFLIMLPLVGGIFSWGFTLNHYKEPLPPELQNAGTARVLTPFEMLPLRGSAAYVYDLKEEKAIYDRNADSQLPLASLTKLITVLLAAESLELDDSVVIPGFVLEANGESALGAGSSWKIRDLIDYALVASSNDAAAALGYATILAHDTNRPTSLSELNERASELMNLKAETLGLTETYFLNPTGLDTSETIAGAYGSARDIAVLLGELVRVYPDLMADTKESAVLIENSSGGLIVENTNQDASQIPGVFASKTGFTDLAGGNLAVAFDVGVKRPVIIVVLGSTREERFTDVERLINATREVIARPNELFYN